MIRRRALSVLACALALTAATAWFRGAGRAAASLPEKIQFNRDIRPILADKCFPCHGPDANKREANLRLDVRDSALADRDGVHAIVPGDTAASELVRRISSRDPDYRMPLPSSNRTLTAREITLLTKWVEQGAEYQPHWAYIAVRRPVPPAVKDTAWIENPIDQFVLAQLEDSKLTPSPDADRRTLARRLSFDLIGLPPTPEEVDAFIHDSSPAAYEHLVDRLLASPHYGERMAAYWLDLVRFADTNGYNEDQHRNIYPYRDYVIRAFNDNIPFDQFTVEQLAGDLLPAPTLSQRVASGYNRLNKVSSENGSQEKEFLAKYAADRVRTTAATWMGSTLGCAECHDHKFDPYTAKDFYSFAAFFADIEAAAIPPTGVIAMPPEIAVPPAEAAATLDELNRKLAELRDQRAASLAENRGRFETARQEWEQAAPQPSTAVVEAQPPFELREWSSMGSGGVVDASGQLRLTSPQGGGKNGIARSVRPGPGDLEFTLDIAALDFPAASTNVMEALDWTLRDASRARALSVFVHRPFGKAILLQAQIERDDIRTVELGTAADVRAVQLRAIWSASNRQWSVSYGLNGAPPLTPVPGGPILDSASAEPTGEWTESIGVRTAPLDRPANPGSAAAQDSAAFGASVRGHVIRRHDPLEDPPAEIAAVRAMPRAGRSAMQQRALEEYYESVSPQLADWNGRIARLEVSKRVLEATLPHTLTTVAIEPRVTRVLNRGNWLDESGEVVQPAVPAFLPRLPTDATPNRLALARWLVSPENPLTARVLVNRLWKLYFGRGIVRTLDDLGAQGARPSHPELLDWLASELVDSGWNVKHVIRLITTSRSYRQSSAERPDLREIDPENQLYARQSSFRLDAEMIRDNALAVSGLLSEVIGGPSVKPYQPEHYWDGVSTVIPGSPAAAWSPSKGPDQYRRGLYTYWKRTFVHPSMLAFDAPTREECVAERTRSSTPLQALVLLNDPSYVEAARVLAERTAHEGGADPEVQIRWAYRQTLAREPETEVLGILRALYDKHLREYRTEPQATQLLVKIGNSPSSMVRDDELSRLAALTSVCRVLLNLNETITRY